MGEPWISIVAQLPLVGLFGLAVWKAAIFVRDFVSSILESHREERVARDAEWREWLRDQNEEFRQFIAEQRTGYLAGIQELSESLATHDSRAKEFMEEMRAQRIRRGDHEPPR